MNRILKRAALWAAFCVVGVLSVTLASHIGAHFAQASASQANGLALLGGLLVAIIGLVCGLSSLFED
jgi:uncharacterized sodium:solute symporter family permease YidK